MHACSCAQKKAVVAVVIGHLGRRALVGGRLVILLQDLGGTVVLVS